jgi:hypothetical protein
MPHRNVSDRKARSDNSNLLSACATLARTQWVKLLMVALLITIAAACERHANKRDAGLIHRGLELRRSIVNEYAKLKVNKGETEGVDLTPIISQYIPKGTSFSDAVTILKAGDFKVMPSLSYRYGKEVIFLIDAHIELHAIFLTSATYAHVDLHVDKIKPSPTTVVEAEGHIETTQL